MHSFYRILNIQINVKDGCKMIKIRTNGGRELEVNEERNVIRAEYHVQAENGEVYKLKCALRYGCDGDCTKCNREYLWLQNEELEFMEQFNEY
jgi:hypothetical protein